MTVSEGGDADFNARDRFDHMHQDIRNSICLLDYAPGARLSEVELAAEFGVSRTPLRRVLTRLEGEGLVQSVQGVGTFVTDVDIEALTQVYMLRMELAELTGKLAPIPASVTLMARFYALSKRSKVLIDSPEPRAFAQLNMDYFLSLLELSANHPLREVSERLYFQTTRIWLKSAFASSIDLNEEVQVFGREVDDTLAAIEMGDVRAATLIQRAHISMSFSRMRR
ncbi:GntR family transcriptional regulator [Shimia sp.]|uniref:GntR family transcriptional regulator n=1 Tax=Shimia sp. TaxID=1954381 RepID=UPI003B8B7090